MLNAFVNLPAAPCNSLWLTPVALVNEFHRRAKTMQPADRRLPGGPQQANAMAF